MRRWIISACCVVALATALGLAQPGQPVRVLLTPASAVVPALLDIVRQSPTARSSIRYVSAYNVTPEEVQRWDTLLRFTFGSLSRIDLYQPPVLVADRVWRVDLRYYGISPASFDNLLALGSGQSPFPEPYFSAVTVIVEQETRPYTEYWVEDANGTWIRDPWFIDSRGNRIGNPRQPTPGVFVRTGLYPGDKLFHRSRVVQRAARGTTSKTSFKSSLAPWLPVIETVELQRQTQTQFPIVRADWLVVNALIEPRYHELLGINNEADIDRLVGSDARQADRFGSQVRGAVLFSEVAIRNRILERTPGLNRARGPYKWDSFDFQTSVAAQDVLFDPLISQVDAHEIIYTLPNGLQGYLIVDGKGNRLDVAAANIATDRRTTFRDPQVWTARNCMACHARGLIAIDDEVRQRSNGLVALTVQGLTGRRGDDARRIYQKYFKEDLTSLIVADQESYGAAVRAITGRAPASIALDLEAAVNDHLSRPLGLTEFAPEFGYDPLTIASTIQRTPGLSGHLVGAANVPGRPTRRDNFDQQFGSLATVLATVPQQVTPVQPAVKIEGK